uniref:cytochrome c biogenesis protein transmembrane region n=1 Tax=Campylaephora boydenii TaxID=202204 RepID=UPI002551F666|nr:cytochrome c biogenesis protein transmembrane region [Campylaephora boydenii]WGT74098.1 cytochrome c biogenesis protein transmembrane region [Campylaephora boydenii]
MQQIIFLYNQINIVFYLLEHKLYSNLSFYYDQFNLLKLLSLFFIGIFTSLTPCFISVLPAVLSSTVAFNNFNIFIKLSLFTGLITSLVGIIIILYLGNGKFDNILRKIPLISSFIFIWIALNLLEIISLAFVVNHIDLVKNNNNIYLKSYLTGFGLGFSCLPCNCSLILTTILWLYNSDKIVESLIYLLIYLFSCLLPFIVIFFLPFRLLKFQKFIMLWDSIIGLGGFYMLTMGCFIFFQQVL